MNMNSYSERANIMAIKLLDIIQKELDISLTDVLYLTKNRSHDLEEYNQSDN